MYFFPHRIQVRERQGGRGPIFTQEQERAIINMVLANNAITLGEIHRGSSLVVLLIKISPVMLTEFSGLIQLGEEIIPNIFPAGFSFLFFSASLRISATGQQLI